MHNLKRSSTIVVICIYYGKWSIYLWSCTVYCMTCSPWLLSAFRNFKALRDIVHILINILYLCHFFNSAACNCLKVIFDVFSYDEHNLIKTTFYSIINRIVKKNFTIRSYWLNLLETTKSATHSGSHNNKCSFFIHNHIPFLDVYVIVCTAPSKKGYIAEIYSVFNY